MNGIETRLVCGFLDAGKTSYISDCIRNDYFHKYGTTLILCFEQGEEAYDEAFLAERRTFAAYHEEGQDVRAFCEDAIARVRPDRIYAEMNLMMPGLREQFPESMKVSFVCAFIDWATLPLYLKNFRQMIGQMVAGAHQIVFRGCPSKELLAPYSQTFRLMNAKASYLRQDPMGYHEKAFDLFVPFPLDAPEITVGRKEYLPLWLDALDHPEHYDGKRLRFTDPLELRLRDDGSPAAGCVVMTCCMADLQFLSFPLDADAADTEKSASGNAREISPADTAEPGKTVPERNGWFSFDALAVVGSGDYGRRLLKLRPENFLPAQPPAELILKPGEE